jgi:hypothetical protein
MKIHRVICLGAALMVATPALAKMPYTNDAFGKVEGTLDFCAQVDSHSASKYQERKKALVKDVPQKEVDEARESKEYKDAYDWVTDEFGKAPKDQAVQACSAYLDGK